MSSTTQVQLPQRFLQAHQAGDLIFQWQRAKTSHRKGLPIGGWCRRCRCTSDVFFRSTVLLGHIVKHSFDLRLDAVATSPAADMTSATASTTTTTTSRATCTHIPQIVRHSADVQIVPIVDDAPADPTNATNRSSAMDRRRPAATSGPYSEVQRATIIDPLADDRSRIGIDIVVSLRALSEFAPSARIETGTGIMGTGNRGTRTTRPQVARVVRINRVIDYGIVGARGYTDMLPGTVIVISKPIAAGVRAFVSPGIGSVIVKA